MLRKVALTLLALVIVACYAVPYLFIGHVAAWYGSFLFWACAGLVVIVLNVLATAGGEGDR